MKRPAHCLQLIWCKSSEALHHQELLFFLSLARTKPRTRTRHKDCSDHRSPPVNLPQPPVGLHFPAVSSTAELSCNEWEFRCRCIPGWVGARELESVLTSPSNDSDLRCCRCTPKQNRPPTPLEPSSLVAHESCSRYTYSKCIQGEPGIFWRVA